MTVFLDSSYFVARIIPADQWADAARTPARPGLRAVTSSLVINETVALLQMRGLLSTALEFLAAARNSPSLSIIYPDAASQAEGWELFQRWAGSGASPVDCVSFAIMKRFGIRKAYTFDKHFRAAGFEILR
jgi:uncharacterized protein